jgi:hypothetical protein
VEYVAGSADQKLIEEWDGKLKACQQARISFERQWHENLAFYFGRQWITTTKTPQGSGFMLAEAPITDKYRVRHTSNRILRIIRTELTKLTKEEPQFFVQPDSTEEKDRMAAMAGESIAEFLIRTKYFNRKRTEATLWALLCGTGFLKNYYDPNKLEIDNLPGKICLDAVTAYHIFVKNLHVVDIEEQPFVIQARTMEPDEVFLTWGVDLEPDTDASSTIVDSRFLNSMGIKSQTSGNKQCYVKEVYVKPNKAFPNGAMFAYGGNRILYVYEPQEPEGILGQGGPSMPSPEFEQLSLFAEVEDRNPVGDPVGDNDEPDKIEPPKSIHDGLPGYNHDYPYAHKRYPFAKIDHIPTGMFYAESVIKSLIPSQKEYNRTRSQMLEHRNMATKPQWAFVNGAFDQRKFTSKPGLLLPINMGFEPPKALEMPQLPPSVQAELETTLRDMDDISSQFEVAKGRVPPGIEAASAIAYLSEENDTILHHTIQSIETAVQETGIQILSNVHEFWDEARVIRMTSNNDTMEVRQFKAADLKPVMDFRVEPGSMAPRSLAAKQAFIVELMKMGAIDPSKALRYLQMSETNKLYEEMMLDVRHAKRENVYMSQGQALTKVDQQKTQQQLQMLQQAAQEEGLPFTPEMLQAQMQPVYKQKQQLDPMTAEPVFDEMGQPVMYNITVNPYDDHLIHIEEHQAFQKTQEYEMLPPDVQQIFQDHVDEHKMEVLQERNVIQADAAMKGGETPPERELAPQASPNGETANV